MEESTPASISPLTRPGMSISAQELSSPQLTTAFLRLVLFWSAAILALAVWDCWQTYADTFDGARASANESYSKDVIYRRWASRHGGLYVPVSAETPPNPYLSGIAERDISTPSGRKLTLINPAYMTRQVHELGRKDFGSQGHITSLNPLRPENAADEWETRALKAFERGESEFSSLEQLGGVTYLRFMRPLLTEDGCLKCHAQQGYKAGDIRGGISVSIPWAPYREELWTQLRVHIAGYGGIWTIGFFGLRLGRRRLESQLSGRRQAEGALRDSEESYHDALATSLDGFWMTDLDGRLVDVNDAYVRMSGYTREELLAMRIEDLDAGRGPQDVAVLIERCVASGGELLESMHRKKDGSLWQAEINVHYGRAAGGRLYVFVRDIYQRKRIETLKKMQLGFSEVMLHGSLDDLLQAILDAAEMLTSSQIGFFHFVDPDQEHIRLQTWSTNTLAHMCRAQGKGQHYPVSQAGIWVDCVRARRPVIHNDYASLAHKKGLPEGHARITRELTVPVLRGGLVVAIIGVGNKPGLYTAEDEATVVELANMALELVESKRAQEALRENEAHLHALFEYSPVSIWEQDFSAVKAYLDELRANGTTDWRAHFNAHPEDVFRCAGLIKIVDVNRTSVKFLGGQSKPDVIRGLADYFMAEAMPVLKEELIALAGGQTRFEADIPIRTLKGERKTVSLTVVFVPGAEDSWAHVLVSFLDITERNLNQDRISRLNADLERRVAERTHALEVSNRELESYSYAVSHDLRAPLRAINGFSRLIEDEYTSQLDERGKNYLGRVRTGAERMSVLIDDLLKLSQISRQEMQSRPVDLSALALEITAELRAADPARAVEWNIAPGLAITGDPGLIRVALQNLLSNAWKYTSKRDLARIEFGTTQKDGREVYFVRDNGAGFDMAYADKLFGAFQRLHSPDAFPGTGIGLATVARVIHRHGGEVWAEGRENEGATFYFTV